jgi:hypothetical protein
MIREIEVRMVEHIEKVAAQLQAMAFTAKRNALSQREIEVFKARPD